MKCESWQDLLQEIITTLFREVIYEQDNTLSDYYFIYTNVYLRTFRLMVKYKKRGKRGEGSTQKQVGLRLDPENIDFVMVLPNKNRFINDLIRKHREGL